ncbi:MAG: DUF2281 domain-containing protein [Lamprobacter sp.]|uniref:DUF2281 domain-containing protein n=1 Tax=Lamprobacter sp. TaxID=3100796 RepID=UPI002B256C63|nr:DUF2281 domain-containing protein [Lamprobacter sp.]MEA3641187.1 DUF2281 domain-containing protein [Lamprobacter sp.]
MNIEAQILSTVRVLPPERQAEVLDFASFLQQRVKNSKELRPIGLCQGEFQVPDDFDAPLPEDIMRDFEQ